jgi:predicted nucleotidyltransferase
MRAMIQTRPDESELVERVVAALKAEGASAVYVFGSFAEGRAGADSDVDVAVSGVPASRFFAAAGAALAAVGGSGRMIDVIDLDSPTPFTRYLRDSGSLRRVG